MDVRKSRRPSPDLVSPQSNSTLGIELTDLQDDIEEQLNDSVHRSESKLLKHVIGEDSERDTIKVDIYDGNSPYAEVRASVSNRDDKDMLQSTIRMWVIGLFLMSGATIMNAIYFVHDPPFVLSPYLIMILAWPFGLLWGRFVPNKWGLNPGPFTYKEHVLISMMAASSNMLHSSETAVSLTFFRDQTNLGGNILFVTLMDWSAALAGLAIAGPLCKIIVEPASMIWPQELVTVTLLSNIHVKWNHVANGWRITREKLFFIVAFGCGIYSFLVHFLADFLSYFSFASWISPENYVVNQLFGTMSGAGMFPITFDWNIVAGTLPSPLIPPARVFANAGIGLVVFIWIVGTAVHYSNVLWGRYVPFADARIFDRFGKPYLVHEILLDGLRLDVKAYDNYSAVYLATTRIISFGLTLAASTSLIVHMLLFDSSKILSGFKSQSADIHALLMRNYRSVPLWWSAVIFSIAVGIAYICDFAFDTGVSGYYPVLAFVLVAIWVIPVTAVSANTTIVVAIDSLILLLTGYMDPGNAFAMMLFKNWTVSALETSAQYLGSMKLGQYTKVSPRLVFAVRLIGILWNSTLQMVVLVKVKPFVSNECHLNSSSGYICSREHTYYTDVIIWGVIGSKRMMENYASILHFLWVGALMPLLWWLWLKKRPGSKLGVVHWPILFSAVEKIPTASPYNYSCWVAVGVLFSRWIRRYWHSWWAKYCYTLSAALDVGLAVMELVLFFIYLRGGYMGPRWWGTSGYQDNIDGRSQPLIVLKNNQSFAPAARDR
nr:Isp4 [Starmerella bombicola]